jgi:SAM-dependent methyltransferase
MPVDAKTFRPTAHGKVHCCTSCSFEYIAPRPTPQETAGFYDIGGYYTQGRDNAPQVGPPGWLARLRTHLAWRFDRSQDIANVITERLAAGASVVDIGCGDGSMIAILSQRGFRMTGVERDARSVSLRDQAAQVFEGSAEALPAQLPRAGFDAVMFRHVLEHLVDPVAAMRAAAALLKPGGLLFAEVPNNESATALELGLSWEHMDVPRHINFFSATTLLAAARRAGLAVERPFFNEYCRMFDDGLIAKEQRIFDHLFGAQPAQRNSTVRAWRLLLRTLRARPELKYDSVGVVAVKPG